MKRRRKRKHCLNCGLLISEEDNYCGKCGQENNDKNVSFITLLRDFRDNYFSYDSKFILSIKPFLFKPGLLTLQYLEGKRLSYVHPLRLYLVLSLFYFFMLSMVGNWSMSDKLRIPKIQNDMDQEVYRQQLHFTLDSVLQKNPGSLNTDSLVGKILENNTSSKKNLPGKKKITDFIKWALDESISDEDLITAWNMENTPLTRLGVKQARKILKGDLKIFLGYILRNFPFMMFLVLPVFALILKLLYIRRNHLYIKHLVHTLHIHSFAFLFYGLVLFIIFFANLWGWKLQIVWWVIGSFILVSTYTYISFLKVYQQGWFKTFIKFNLAGVIYINFLLVCFLSEVVVSFLLF